MYSVFSEGVDVPSLDAVLFLSPRKSKVHINEEKVLYSLEVGGLIVLGLAYHTGVSEDNIPEYSFTALAKIINRYAINGDALGVVGKLKVNDRNGKKHKMQETFS